MAAFEAIAMPSSVNSQPHAAPSAPTIERKTHVFKAADLPLTSAVRSAIEGLAYAFKKKGGYDVIRKQAWDKFEASVCSPTMHLVT